MLKDRLKRFWCKGERRKYSKTSLTFLALHRDGNVWRLVVPASAVDRIARQLSATLRP